MVAWARAASMASAMRLFSIPLPAPPPAASVSLSRAAWQAASSRSARSLSSLASCSVRTREFSTLRTSISWSSVTTYLLTPITGWRPESIRAWVRAAASSMRSLGIPSPIACAIPPASSISMRCSRALSAS